MKAGKRIAALVLAGVMVFGNATPAMAANVKDASFKFSAGTKYTASEKRQKTNTTSVYVRVDSSKAKSRIQVYGEIPTGQSGTMKWKNCNCKTKDGRTYVIARPGVSSSIRTVVYEKGGRSAKLKGRSDSGKTGTAGVWSPDSTRQYKVLN